MSELVVFQGSRNSSTEYQINVFIKDGSAAASLGRKMGLHVRRLDPARISLQLGLTYRAGMRCDLMPEKVQEHLICVLRIKFIVVLVLALFDSRLPRFLKVLKNYNNSP